MPPAKGPNIIFSEAPALLLATPTVEAAPYAAHIPKSVTMSFLFGGRPQLSSAEKIAAAETEIEMVSDMFNRLLPRFKIIILSEAH